MRRHFPLLYIIFVLFIGCYQGSTAPSKFNPPNWQPDQQLLNELDAYEDFEGYQIRPPKGYESGDKPSPKDNARALAWTGTPRSDGSQPKVTVILQSSPIKEFSDEELLDAILDITKKDKEYWQQTPAETGRVNDITFVKSSWQGQDTQTKSKMHGIVYVARDGSTIIHLRAYDIEPYHTEALKIGNDSLLTFRKK
jgi:hypothetical protein